MKEVSAGGVVFRKQGEQTEVLLIEDRYMRVSLPKGKQEAGETLEQTALREVKEETGIDGRIIEPLEVIYYRYYHPQLGSVDKEVHYYLVEATSGELLPQIEEINKAQWFEPAKAWDSQIKHGYDNNHSVIDKAFMKLNLERGGK